MWSARPESVNCKAVGKRAHAYTQMTLAGLLLRISGRKTKVLTKQSDMLE